MPKIISGPEASEMVSASTRARSRTNSEASPACRTGSVRASTETSSRSRARIDEGNSVSPLSATSSAEVMIRDSVMAEHLAGELVELVDAQPYGGFGHRRPGPQDWA